MPRKTLPAKFDPGFLRDFDRRFSLDFLVRTLTPSDTNGLLTRPKRDDDVHSLILAHDGHLHLLARLPAFNRFN